MGSYQEAEMKVSDVMTTPVLTTQPDVPLKEAALTLVREGISGLPVVDAEGRVIGVLSEADVIAKEGVQPRKGGFLSWLLEPSDAWLEGRLAARTVGEAMSAPAVTITPNRPLAAAATRMIDERVNRLPVVDGERLVGIVSRADLVRAFVRTDAEIRAEIEEEVVRRTMWLEPTDVAVTVEGGHVKLRGTVGTPTDAQLLPSLVRRVAGVVDVESAVSARDI